MMVTASLRQHSNPRLLCCLRIAVTLIGRNRFIRDAKKGHGKRRPRKTVRTVVRLGGIASLARREAHLRNERRATDLSGLSQRRVGVKHGLDTAE